MASVDPTITSTVADVDTTVSAWDASCTAYTNKVQTRIFSLSDRPARLTKESQYLQSIQSLLMNSLLLVPQSQTLSSLLRYRRTYDIFRHFWNTSRRFYSNIGELKLSLFNYSSDGRELV